MEIRAASARHIRIAIGGQHRPAKPRAIVLGGALSLLCCLGAAIASLVAYQRTRDTTCLRMLAVGLSVALVTVATSTFIISRIGLFPD